MNGIFNVDNPVFSILNKLCDVLLLSLLWVILCIPIITIGPATTALYYATVKSIRKERGYVFREFFKSFRMNFKTGAIVGLILTFILVLLSLDVWMARSSMTSNLTFNSVMFGIYLAIIVFILCFSIYVYPILSRFSMTLKQLIKAAAFMSLKHFLLTIVMLLILLAAIGAVIFLPITIVFIPVGATWMISLIMEMILKKYIPESDSTDDSVKDKWYLE